MSPAFIPNPPKWASRSLIILPVLALLFATVPLKADDTGTGPNLFPGDFESGTPSYNPWGGVDNIGYLHVWSGTQLAADDSGTVVQQAFSPSIAVGDLNGDGLPDLVVGDVYGFFWFFPNSGKPGAPAFTQGEIMPVWLGRSWEDGDVVPRIQLIDLGDNKLSLVAGTFAGQLYFIHNRGTATSPDFSTPQDHSSLEVFTHSEGFLWCNFLSPFLYDWGGQGRLDLLMGEGSYSANSIYLLTNQGNNGRPLFREQQRIKIIPGMGREHLTPQVVDWNNDGKPDIIAGERTGYINVYLNQNTDNSYPPTFDKDHPIHVNFGGADKFGAFPTVCVADLNNDKLFDLVLGNPDGRLYYALNTGTPGSPKFGTPVPFKGVYPYTNVNPFSKVFLPQTWSVVKHWPAGAPGALLQCTNASIEPGFTPPPGPDFKGKGAMRFSVGLPPAKYFKDQFFPPNNGDFTHRAIRPTISVDLETDTRYILSFWVRGDGAISNLTWRVFAHQMTNSWGTNTVTKGQTIDVSNTWNKVHQTVEIRSLTNKKPDISTKDELTLIWDGDGTIYFDDITLKKAH